MHRPTRCRSVLFAPATRPDLARKLPRSGPDMVVIDLEDAVPADAKETARATAAESVAALRATDSRCAVFIRVNGPASEWFADDLATLAGTTAAALDGVVVPKIEQPAHVEDARYGLAAVGAGDLALFAGIETVAGVISSTDVCRAGIDFVYFGAEDYIADLGGVRTEEGDEVLLARSSVAIAARGAGIPATDQVVTAYRDDDLFRADAAKGRSLGYRGKLCIHPAQVALANAVFSPSAAQLAHARGVIAAYEARSTGGVGVVSYEGQMIDEPLVAQARAVIGSADGA